MSAIGVSVGPPGLFTWFWIIPGPHGPGRGYVGLPALSRIRTLMIIRRCVAINP